MQQTSETYRRILLNSNHWFETTVVIGESGVLITERAERILFGGVAIIVARDGPSSGFGEEQIFSVRTTQNMLQQGPQLGTAIAAEIELTMLNPPGDIPNMALLVPYVRACSDTEQSEWIQQGVYYVDTREVTQNSDGLNILTLHGFDAMLKAEPDPAAAGTVLDTAMVQEIATMIGVTVDDRTWDIMTDGFRIPLPTQYTLREILGYIAGAYAGVFLMTDLGELRLVSITDLPEETSLLIDSIGEYITFGGTRIKLTATT